MTKYDGSQEPKAHNQRSNPKHNLDITDEELRLLNALGQTMAAQETPAGPRDQEALVPLKSGTREEVLRSYGIDPKPFRSTSPIYPWEEWGDGKFRVLKQGRDFDVSAQAMRTQIHNRAKREGKFALTEAFGEDQIGVQFFASDAQRNVAKDMRRRGFRT